MKSRTPHQLKILTFVGLFCLFIPFSILELWIHSFNLGTTQSERVEIFHKYFPEFLHGRFDTTFLSIAFCVLAILLCSFSLSLPGKFWKVLNIIVLVFSVLLLFLNLFSMM